MFNCDPLKKDFNKKKMGIDRGNLLTYYQKHSTQSIQNWMKNNFFLYLSNMRKF